MPNLPLCQAIVDQTAAELTIAYQAADAVLQDQIDALGGGGGGGGSSVTGIVYLNDYGTTSAAGTALNAAMAALPSGGGKVIVPAGTWTIDTAVLFAKSNVTIEGVGSASIFQFDGGTVTTAFKMTDTTGRAVFLRNFQILQTGASPAGIAIDATHFQRGIISNIYMDGTSGATNPPIGGILLAGGGGANGSYYNLIEHVRIRAGGTGSYCIKFDSVANRNFVHDARLFGSSTTACVIVNAHAIKLDGVVVETTAQYGIDVQASGHDCTIISPYLEACATGIRLASGVEATTIVGGFVADSGTANITDLGAQGLSVVNTRLQYAPATYRTTNQGLATADVVVNVRDYGATGAGSGDDAAAIQAAIDGSPVGSTIYFPPGTYLVGTTIELLESRRYTGSHRERCTIKQANGANLDAVMASETWLSASSTTSDNLITVEKLTIDGNKANQTGGDGHGLAVVSFWSDYKDLIIYDARGDGVHVSSARQDGTEVSNTAVENHLYRIDVRGAGAHGIHVYDPTVTTQTVTDGWLIDCIVHDPTEDGIRVDCSAGWLVQGCHVYGAPKHGIHMGRADSTRVIGNYVETFGASATVGWYAGIALGDGAASYIGSTNPSIISGNTLFYSGGAAPGGGITGIVVSTSNGASSHVVITGNGLYGTGTSEGISLTNQGATASTNATISGNIVRGWSTRYGYNVNGGIMHIEGGDVGRVGIATTATEGFGRLPTCAGTPTGVPGSTTEGAPVVYDTTANKLWVYNGSWRSVTLA